MFESIKKSFQSIMGSNATAGQGAKDDCLGVIEESKSSGHILRF